MRLHVYSGDEAMPHTIADADDNSSLDAHVRLAEGEAVFAVDDEGLELDPAAALTNLFADGIGRAVTHPGRQVTVTVSYAGESAVLSVSPGARVGAIRAGAISALGIDEAAAVDLGIREIGAHEDLDLDRPIASVAKGSDTVDLELVATVRPQG